MKKQIVSACALIASVAAFATSVTSENTFGVMKIAAPAKVSSSLVQLIIPVPWENVGASTGAIDPTAYVLATNRKKDDALFYYDTAQKVYKVWVMSEDGSASGAWTAKSSYVISGETESNETEIDTIFADGSFARGKAVILQLQSGSTADIYLSGQYSSTTSTVVITGPAATSHAWWVVYNLIAPSLASEVTLNNLSFYKDDTGEVAVEQDDIVGDKIVKADGTTYYCEADEASGIKWVYYEPSDPGVVAIPTGTIENVKLKVGEGAWYVRAVHKNGVQTIHVNW